MKKGLTTLVKDIDINAPQDNNKRKENEWKATFDCISDLVSVHDRDFRILKVNKAFIDFCGQPEEKLIGRKCHTLLHSDKKRCPNCPHKKAMETKKPASAEIFEPALGRYFEVSASPIFDESGNVTGSV